MEVRWWGQGEAPALLEEWFQEMPGESQLEPKRVDRYFPVNTDRLGIKLRQGRIEIKRRRGLPQVVQFHPQINGIKERWEKLGLELAPGLAEAVEGPWIDVAKTRRLHWYRMEEDGYVRPVADAAACRGHGCEVELSTVEAEDERWWSLCFEAFGDPQALDFTLSTVADHALAVDHPPLMIVEDSYAYPRWLSRL
jgi:hypothetical protein